MCIYKAVKRLAAFYETGLGLKAINVTPTNIKNSSEKVEVKRLRTRSVLIPLKQDELIKHSRVFMEKHMNLNIATTDND